MNYVTGNTIRMLREQRGMTQAELAEKLGVSDKTISKWETMRGLPDITLIGDLSEVLGVSVGELFAGECVINQNASGNMRRSKFYVCPICGNIMHSMGEAAISCCGVTLPVQEAEKADATHPLHVERDGDEYYVTIDHPMTKDHYISFLAYVSTSRTDWVKLYPEGMAEARFFMRGHGTIYAYCNHHGLYEVRV